MRSAPYLQTRGRLRWKQRDNPFTHPHAQADVPRHTKNPRNPQQARFVQRDVRISLIGLPLAAVCLAGFTAACSGQVPADGTLTGHLYGVGGPAPGSPRPWPGTVTLTGPGVHRDVPVGATGSYSVMVPAGSYTVAGRARSTEAAQGCARQRR
jgi:hypothetical protein